MSKRASILPQKDLFFRTPDRESHPVESFMGPAQGQAVLLPVDRIKPNPDQPRRTFPEDSIVSLAASIKEKGLLQPISVSQQEDGFVLVAGERRWRAHQKAGLPKIRAFIVNVEDPDEAFEISLIENLQREDLGPVEEAAGIAELMKRRGYKQRQVAQVVGRSEAQVSQLLKLAKLPAGVKKKVSTSKLSRDQLFQVASQETPKAMLKLLDQVVEMGLNVRETRQAAKGARPAAKKHPLLSRLSRFEKTLAQVYQENLSRLEGEEKKQVAAILSALSDLIDKMQRRLQS